ncbi:hypothetical protein KDW98_22640 [Burkholderia vietnamiensis]|uniref:hypothetical protein n=1 Tax=Burkholderia vietnamiensis TaxID=60552 RepID=UPI001B94D52E|nr:hypothetical protein [Burkholderia vietnamiensis]MBR8163965.1 hypothetical protein [Burkholderia vietnamiensis]
MTVQASKKYSQSSEKRMAFLERVEHYVNKRPMWTAAEGALLVNGVMPPPKGCADIPDDAAQLEDPVQPATQSQLLGARMLLREYRRDVENGDASQTERITSDEFLEWCKDGDFLPAWTLKLVEFLRHLYFPGDAHNQFPQTVEEELAMLRMVMAAKEMQSALVSHTRAAEPPAVGPLQADVGSAAVAPPVPAVLGGTIGLKKRELQIRAIEAAADALKFDRKKIRLEGKERIREWCQEHHVDLFGAGKDPFKDAWQEASKNDRIIIEDRERFRRKR